MTDQNAAVWLLSVSSIGISFYCAEFLRKMWVCVYLCKHTGKEAAEGSGDVIGSLEWSIFHQV